MQERGGKHLSPSNIFKIIDRKKTLVYENRVPSVFFQGSEGKQANGKTLRH